MSTVDFQLVDDEQFDDSIIKRDFIKLYHQSGADFNNQNSNIKFYFGENHKFTQDGNRYLEFDIKIGEDDNSNFSITAPGHDVIRLVNEAFAYTLHIARLSNSSGVEIEQNKFLGPISTIMRSVTQKDGDLSSYFDVIDESEAGIDDSAIEQILNNNVIADNRGIIRGRLTL